MVAKIASLSRVKIGDLKFAAILFADVENGRGKDLYNWFDEFGTRVYGNVAWLEIVEDVSRCLEELEEKSWPEDLKSHLTRKAMPFILFIERDFPLFDAQSDEWILCKNCFLPAKKGDAQGQLEMLANAVKQGHSVFEVLKGTAPSNVNIRAECVFTQDGPTKLRPKSEKWDAIGQRFLADAKAGDFDNLFTSHRASGTWRLRRSDAASRVQETQAIDTDVDTIRKKLTVYFATAEHLGPRHPESGQEVSPKSETGR